MVDDVKKCFKDFMRSQFYRTTETEKGDRNSFHNGQSDNEIFKRISQNVINLLCITVFALNLKETIQTKFSILIFYFVVFMWLPWIFRNYTLCVQTSLFLFSLSFHLPSVTRNNETSDQS